MNDSESICPLCGAKVRKSFSNSEYRYCVLNTNNGRSHYEKWEYLPGKFSETYLIDKFEIVISEDDLSFTYFPTGRGSYQFYQFRLDGCKLKYQDVDTEEKLQVIMQNIQILS